jgi:hypothetical protein
MLHEALDFTAEALAGDGVVYDVEVVASAHALLPNGLRLKFVNGPEFVVMVEQAPVDWVAEA